MIELVLEPLPPFRLDLTVWLLRRLPINAMDRWDGHVYTRTIAVHETPAELAVVQTGSPARPRLDVMVKGLRASHANESAITGMLNKLLGPQVDLSDFYRVARADKRFSQLAERFGGCKPPRMPTVFEAFVNGVSCQQISLSVGITLLNRLCHAYGQASEEHHAFPRPHDLRIASPEALRAMGYSTRKAEYILGMAQAVDEGGFDLEGLADLDDAQALEQLRRLPGVGRWTAEYIALRGLGRLDALPGDDVGIQNRLQLWLGLKDRPAYDAVHKLVSRWRPYRGLMYFHLLLDSLSRKGALEEVLA